MKAEKYRDLIHSVFRSVEGVALLQEWEDTYNAESCYRRAGEDVAAIAWRDGCRTIILDINRVLKSKPIIDDLPF